MALPPNSISSALSNAINNGPQVHAVSMASVAASPRDPAKQIYAIDSQTSSLLQFPSDRPKYYMQFNIYKYKRENLRTIGQLGGVLSTIVMPLAQQLIDAHQVHWDDNVRLGTAGGFAMDQIAPTITAAGQGAFAQPGKGAALAGLGAIIASVGLDWANEKTNGALGNVVLPGLQSLLGFSPNQFMTVVFQGPLYKRHNFSWSLSPRNFAEADSLRKITNTLNNAQSPNLAAGGLVWEFPKIIWPSFMPNSKFMYKFKPAVIESFHVNYTPSGRAAMYHADNVADNAPHGLSMNMRLMELEYWLDGNYTDSNEPQDVYNNTPSNIDKQLLDILERLKSTVDVGSVLYIGLYNIIEGLKQANPGLNNQPTPTPQASTN